MPTTARYRKEAAQDCWRRCLDWFHPRRRVTCSTSSSPRLAGGVLSVRQRPPDGARARPHRQEPCHLSGACCSAPRCCTSCRRLSRARPARSAVRDLLGGLRLSSCWRRPSSTARSHHDGDDPHTTWHGFDAEQAARRLEPAAGDSSHSATASSSPRPSSPTRRLGVVTALASSPRDPRSRRLHRAAQRRPVTPPRAALQRAVGYGGGVGGVVATSSSGRGSAVPVPAVVASSSSSTSRGRLLPQLQRRLPLRTLWRRSCWIAAGWGGAGRAHHFCSALNPT